MTPDELRERTKSLALRIVKVYRSLPKTADAQVMGKQLLRSGTSVAQITARHVVPDQRAEFAARIGVVVEEADETGLWLEMLSDAGIVPATLLVQLLQESKELTAIFTATMQSVRKRK